MARKAAIIGGGVIGGGWAARFLLNGWNVSVFDPDPQAERKISEVMANARAALPALSDVPMGPEGSPAAAVDGRGAVRGVRGLTVADASIMPTIPAVNTNLPTLMIGERFGQWAKDGALPG